MGKERILSWKGKDPFLSQERSSLQLGKVSVILGKERILSFPRMVKRKASKGERKGKDSDPPFFSSMIDDSVLNVVTREKQLS